MKPKETLTLAAALDLLARTVSAAITEATDRLRAQDVEVERLTVQLRTNHTRAEEIIEAREATAERLHAENAKMREALVPAAKYLHAYLEDRPPQPPEVVALLARIDAALKS